jgi:hypothetical protein
MAISHATVAAQQPSSDSVTFKSETRAIQINVSVKDAQGRPVHGLRKEDFAVTDNGKPREIQLFSPDEGGSAAPATSGPPNGVFSNRFGSPAAQERITALVIDTGPPLTALGGSRSLGGGAYAAELRTAPGRQQAVGSGALRGLIDRWQGLAMVSRTNQALARECHARRRTNAPG